MKHIDLIIPTRNRWAKLQRCLRSMPQEVPDVKLNIIVVCDGDDVTARRLLDKANGFLGRIIYVREHSGSVYCRNLMTQCAEDAVLYATDDIEFRPGAIEAAVRSMAKHFPDGDGIIGFNQGDEHGFSAAGVGLLGQKFLRRYPQRKLFFPEYFHFSCQEIERLGNRLNRLHLEKEAKLVHYHPSFNHKEMDQTHREARVYRKKDLALSSGRRAAHEIWGLN